MSTYPDRVDLLASHRPYGIDCKCGRPINSDADWARHVDEVERQAYTITTVEQAAALPTGAILKDDEDIFCVDELGIVNLSADPSRRFDGPDLPALLVWSPEWQKP